MVVGNILSTISQLGSTSEMGGIVTLSSAIGFQPLFVAIGLSLLLAWLFNPRKLGLMGSFIVRAIIMFLIIWFI